MGDIVLGCLNFKYFLGCLKFLIFAGVNVDAGPEHTCEEKMRVPPWAYTAIRCEDFIDILYFQLKGIHKSRDDERLFVRILQQ